MRRMFLQREVMEIGKILGWNKLNKQAFYYWILRGRFPKPIAKLPGSTWYTREQVVMGYLSVAQRYGRDIGETNIELAIKVVLAQNKRLTRKLLRFKNITCKEIEKND